MAVADVDCLPAFSCMTLGLTMTMPEVSCSVGCDATGSPVVREAFAMDSYALLL